MSSEEPTLVAGVHPSREKCRLLSLLAALLPLLPGVWSMSRVEGGTAYALTIGLPGLAILFGLTFGLGMLAAWVAVKIRIRRRAEIPLAVLPGVLVSALFLHIAMKEANPRWQFKWRITDPVPASVRAIKVVRGKAFRGGWVAMSFSISPEDFAELIEKEEYKRGEEVTAYLEDPLLFFPEDFFLGREALGYSRPEDPEYYVSERGCMLTNSKHTVVYFFDSWG